MSKEHYYYMMNIANTILNDDHTHIHLNTFMKNYTPLFAGFICNLYNIKNEYIMKIILSIDGRIPVDSIILKINNKDAI